MCSYLIRINDGFEEKFLRFSTVRKNNLGRKCAFSSTLRKAIFLESPSKALTSSEKITSWLGNIFLLISLKFIRRND